MKSAGWRVLFLTLCAACMLQIVAISSGGLAIAAGGYASEWRAFFARVLPLVPKDFSSVKGAYLPTDGVYAVKSRFDPKLVANCDIFATGATSKWHMRCDTLGYNSLADLTADVGAALPRFVKGANLMGEPQWTGRRTDRQRHIFVTIVASGGVLISHGDPDAD